jgi:hypothetical protein
MSEPKRQAAVAVLYARGELTPEAQRLVAVELQRVLSEVGVDVSEGVIVNVEPHNVVRIGKATGH